VQANVASANTVVMQYEETFILDTWLEVVLQC
jgi:hypothetical protein